MTQLARITPEELAKHKTKEDCWQAYGGKVDNVTPFIKYHPGGVPELMRANGRDGQALPSRRGLRFCGGMLTLPFLQERNCSVR